MVKSVKKKILAQMACGNYRKILSVAKILEDLELLDPEDFPDDVHILPPDDFSGETDQESGDEDEINPNRLSRRQLIAPAEAVYHQKGDEVINDDDDDDDQPATSIKLTRKWTNGDIKDIDPVAPPLDYVFTPVLTLSATSDPVEFFELFLSADVVSDLAKYTTIYSQQKNANSVISTEEIYAFLGILIITGYNFCPRRRMYWENRRDSHNDLISDTMRRKKFDDIFRHIHVAENTNLDTSDKYSKIRPLIMKVNDKFIRYAPIECNVSIDESMIKYYGRHPCKQFMKSRPIRFGYKAWSLPLKNGYCLQFDLYQGKNFKKDDKYRDTFGLGGSVVLHFADILQKSFKDISFSLYFDNFFTSAKLMTKLRKMNIGATGTVRENRTEKCKILPNKEMKRCSRGTSESSIDAENNIMGVKWMDNNIVMILSNQYGIEPQRKAQRFSLKEAKKVEIQQPNLIHAYNKFMGGVDQMDNSVSNYQIGIRGKKWYMPLIFWIFDVSLNNAWVLSKTFGLKFDKLEFIRQVAEALCAKYDTEKLSPGPINRSHVGNFRKRSGSHLVITGQKRRMCAHCKNKTVTACNTCDVPLHDKCFIGFHN